MKHCILLSIGVKGDLVLTIVVLAFFLKGIEQVFLFFDTVSNHLRDLLFLEGAVEGNQRFDHETEAAEIVEEAVEQLRESILGSDQFQVLAPDTLNYDYKK
jgi:hypothetical protein